VTSVLADPVLTVYDSTGRQFVANDDWNSGTKPDAGIYYTGTATAQGAVSAAIASAAAVSAVVIANSIAAVSQATGAFELDSRSFDAALVTGLTLGLHRAVERQQPADRHSDHVHRDAGHCCPARNPC